MSTIEHAEASLLRYRLDQPVGGSGVGAVDLVLVDLTDSDGATGFGFTYVIGGAGGEVVLEAARQQLERHVLHQPPEPPAALWRRIHAAFNRSGYGPNLVALAAIDVAGWDLEARRRNVSLATALGGVSRPVSVYGSGGFTANQSPTDAAETAAAHAARGLGAVKLRMSGTGSDLKRLEVVRAALSGDVGIMLDVNEKGNIVSARRLLEGARDHGVLFVEEPLPSDAVAGYRTLAAASPLTLAAGEHLQGRAAFLPFISERLLGVVQPDLAMAGGLTPVLGIAALADAFDIVVSPHFLPGLFVHVAAACPAVAWLEEFPLLETLIEGWPELLPEGRLEPREIPGHGLFIEQGARQRFRVS